MKGILCMLVLKFLSLEYGCWGLLVMNESGEVNVIIFLIIVF